MSDFPHRAPRCYVASSPEERGPAGRAARTWAEHHDACKECSRTEWYGPDKEKLCRTGRALFGLWEKAAVTISGMGG